MFMKPTQSTNTPNKKIQLEKISGYFFGKHRIQRTRWDESIEVPPILYQKMKIQPPLATSQQHSKVTYTHPASLIDFIGRAYNKCKDVVQKKAMEAQLREIVDKHKADLHAVNWDKYPVPTLSNLSEQHSEFKHSALQQLNPTRPTIGFSSQSSNSYQPKSFQK